MQKDINLLLIPAGSDRRGLNLYFEFQGPVNMQALIPFAFVILLFYSCQSSEENGVIADQALLPPAHDVGYIQFDPDLDDRNFVLCDSTDIVSGRNRLGYAGGLKVFREECLSKFEAKPAYRSFSGYIVVRFLFNCDAQTGRYRSAALAPNFTVKQCPEDLRAHLVEIVKNMDGWELSSNARANAEFSKFINFKISDGNIEHILL